MQKLIIRALIYNFFIILLPLQGFNQKSQSSMHFDNLAFKKFITHNPFACLEITIPKTGTHLLSKCVNSLYGFNTHQHTRRPAGKLLACSAITTPSFLESQWPEVLRLLQKKAYSLRHRKAKSRVSVHMAHTQERENLLNTIAHKALLLIRDPRDQLVSFTQWVCEDSKLKTAYFNDLLLSFIEGNKKDSFAVVRMYPLANFMWTFGIAEHYKLYLPWMRNQKIYTVKFENLVGAQGGGSEAAQIQEITNIAHHLNITITPQRLHTIASTLFGGTSTFNKGQIGRWKDFFTPTHKEAFKRVAGNLLIELGYEKDLNW